MKDGSMHRGIGGMRALRSLAIAGAIGIVLAACGPSTSNPGTQLAADQTLRFPLNDDIGTFDPAFMSAAVDAAFAQNVFNGLLKFDKDMNIVADLAEKMPDVSSDNLTYTFKLRKD